MTAAPTRRPVGHQPVCRTWPTLQDCIAATFRGSPRPDGKPRYYWHVADAIGGVRDYSRRGWRHPRPAERDGKRHWPEMS